MRRQAIDRLHQPVRRVLSRLALATAAMGSVFMGLTALSTPTAGAAGTSAGTFVSQPGDYIGQGLTYAFTSVTVQSQTSGDLTFSLTNGTDQFTAEFAAPAGNILVPGTYTDVERAPFRTAGFPGLDVGGNGSGCNTVAGSFTVYDATYDTNGKVLTFAAQFFQHCEGFYSQLMGNVSYNSAAQIPALPATPPDVPQSAQLVSMPGDYLGQGQAYSYPIAYPLGETPNRQGPNRWELTSDPSNVVWDIDIVAPNNAPLAVGTYLESTSDAVSLTGPQMMVGGLGKSCTLQDGAFNIYDITYDAMGMLNSMAFEFAIQCIGSTGVLYGAIRWNSNVAMPALPAPQASIVATPAGLNFGNVRVGDYTDPDTVTLTNKGGANAVISSGGLTGSAADDYFGQSNCGTLAPQATCTIDFSFFPGAVGQRSATAIVDDGSATPLLITLSGFGTEGYYEAASSGAVYTFGDAESYGDMSKAKLSAPIVNMTTTPGGFGYWLLGGDGGIFSFGNAQFYGSTGGVKLNRPAIAMASTGDGEGYWLVASDGGIFTFGDAPFYGSTGALRLNKPIVAMAPTPDGGGYWLVASDGGIFSFGDAQFYGSTGGITLNKSIVGMTPTPDGGGYWLVASDGGIFSFGDATYYGSTGGRALSAPIVGMAAAPDGVGYWLVASNGGVFAYGSAQYNGSEVGLATANVVSLVATSPPTLEAQFDVPAARSHLTWNATRR